MASLLKRIAFLNDTSAWYHWGCTGTSEAIKETLAERGYAVTPIPIHALSACQSIPQSTADFNSAEFFNRFFKENLALLAPILKSDIVVINGEGSIHSLSKTSLLLLYLAYASKIYCKKNVQIINHSCYPEGGKATVTPISHFYRDVYRVLDFIAIREHKSLEVMKALGIEATLSFDCLPLYIQRHPAPAPPASRSLVLAGSVAWKPEGMPKLAAYLNAMKADGYDIKLLTGARAYPALDDLRFVEALKAAAPEGWTHVDAKSMQEWLDTIHSAALMLSGRFHYTIAACMLDTPCIVLDSNTPKNSALTESAGLPPPLSYSADDLESVLYERTRNMLGRPPLSEEKKQEWRDRAAQNFKALP
jgi:polysaccharide pyruvyl transferase WcaK-like protein